MNVAAAIRVFNAAAGTWRVTNLGKRWFKQRDVPNSEYVLQLPVIFHTFKQARDNPVVHRGLAPGDGPCAGAAPAHRGRVPLSTQGTRRDARSQRRAGRNYMEEVKTKSEGS